MGRTTASARWAFLGLGVKVVVQGLAAFVVARIVGPDVYGVIGLGLVYVTLTTLVVDQGMGQSLIRAKVLHPGDVATVQVATLTITAVVATVTLVAARPLSGFFGIAALAPLLVLLASGLVLKSLAVCGQAVLQRDFHFRWLAVWDMASATLGVGAGLLTALSGGRTLTLAAQVLVTDGVMAFGILRRAGFPLRGANLTSFRNVVGFSVQIAGSQWLGFLSRNVDNLLIGRVLGSVALGQYSVSYRFMMLPITNLTMVANRVLLPTYSRLQDDREEFRRAFLRSTSLMALTAAPAMALLGVFAPPLILGALGDTWRGAIVPTQILAAVAVLQTQTSLISPAIVAFGRSGWQLKWSLVSTALTVAVFAGTVPFGLNAVCLGYALLNLVTLPIPIGLIGRLGDFRWRDFVRSVLPGLRIGLLVLAVGGAVRVGLTVLGCPALVIATVGTLAAAALSALLVKAAFPDSADQLLTLVGRGRTPGRPAPTRTAT